MTTTALILHQNWWCVSHVPANQFLQQQYFYDTKIDVRMCTTRLHLRVFCTHICRNLSGQNSVSVSSQISAPAHTSCLSKIYCTTLVVCLVKKLGKKMLEMTSCSKKMARWIQSDLVIVECRNSLNLFLQIDLNHNKVYYGCFQLLFENL